MLIKIAWRNIWRNRVRSFVVIFAIALGLWAGVFASAFVQGMMEGKINSIIQYEISHFQFHEKDYREEFKTELYLENTSEIEKQLNADDRIIGYSSRLIAMGMVASANKNGSAKIVGINLDDEKQVTKLDTRLKEGSYFEGIKRNPILVSTRFAEKYKLKLRNKVVVTVQDLDGEITAAVFRIVGFYKTGNGIFDDLNVFVRQSDLRNLLKIQDNDVHEIAVLSNSSDLSDPLAKEYQGQFEDQEVLAWPDLSPGMRYIIDIFDVYLYIIVGIILVALLFSIVNTMLMAVLERVKEIGMLMAVGMTKSKVFMMIMWETIFVSMIGAPLGLLFSYVSIAYFGKVGINLATDVYEEMGFSNVIYPYLEAAKYLDVTIMVVFMALLAAIYPALKALSLKPVEAIRKI